MLGKVRKADHGAVKAALHASMNAPNRPKALSAARRFASAWEETYHQCLATSSANQENSLPFPGSAGYRQGL